MKHKFDVGDTVDIIFIDPPVGDGYRYAKPYHWQVWADKQKVRLYGKITKRDEENGYRVDIYRYDTGNLWRVEAFFQDSWSDAYNWRLYEHEVVSQVPICVLPENIDYDDFLPASIVNVF